MEGKLFLKEVSSLEEEKIQTNSFFSIKALIFALGFGIVALLIVIAGLHLPIPGSTVVTDPRELFTTLGAALSGPVGGVIVGILAGIKEPEGLYLASLLAHIAGGIWMGFAYKRFVYEKMAMPKLLLGWAGLVLAYYYVFVLTGFTIGLVMFYNDPTSLGQLYLTLAKGATPEALLTTVVTSMALFALPKKIIKPLW